MRRWRDDIGSKLVCASSAIAMLGIAGNSRGPARAWFCIATPRRARSCRHTWQHGRERVSNEAYARIARRWAAHAPRTRRTDV